MLKESLNLFVDDDSVIWLGNHWNTENSSEVIKTKLGFLEIPFDHAVSYRPGTRFGPSSIIKALNTYSLYCTDKRTSLKNLSFNHCGVVEILNSFEKTYKNIEKKVFEVPNDHILICLGGDHSISDPILRGLIKKVKSPEKIGLLVFDAHFDSRSPIKDKEHSGHWVKTISDFINYKNVCQLGINANIYSEFYMDDAEKKGIKIFTPYDMRTMGFKKIFKRICEHFSDIDSLYISIDIDVINQSFCPGTSVPNPCGLYPHEVSDLLYMISKSFPILGMDITEVNPLFENYPSTSHVAANLILNFCAGIQNNNFCKKKKK